MSRASSGQSIRVGSQVYQINITPQEGFQLEFRFFGNLKMNQIEIPFQQLEKRNLEKQRERRIR